MGVNMERQEQITEDINYKIDSSENESKDGYRIREKINDFDSVYLLKDIEIKREIESFWGKILTKRIRNDIFEQESEDKSYLNGVCMKKCEQLYKESERFPYRDRFIFEFPNFKFDHAIDIYTKSRHEDYYECKYIIPDRKNQDEILEPETMEEKIKLLKEKRIFSNWITKHGEDIFMKYYSELQKNIDKKIEEIDEMIKEVENI